jgi:hypothetical protein
MNSQVIRALERYLGSDEGQLHRDEALDGLTRDLREIEKNVEQLLRNSRRKVAAAGLGAQRKTTSTKKPRTTNPARKTGRKKT